MKERSRERDVSEAEPSSLSLLAFVVDCRPASKRVAQCGFTCMEKIHFHHTLVPNFPCLSYQVRPGAHWRRAESEPLVYPLKAKNTFPRNIKLRCVHRHLGCSAAFRAQPYVWLTARFSPSHSKLYSKTTFLVKQK